jgi:2'-hydroxyisoflavone reductase
MRILVLGGTQLVGRAIVETALTDGHELTLFNRGRTNAGLFPGVEQIHGDRDGGLDGLATGSWDVCVDVSGYLPRVVGQSVDLLTGRVGRYVFISTISVYADLAEPRDEDSPRATLDDPETEKIDGMTYGALKARCEDVVRERYGGDATIIRPGYVIGAHDHTGRFPWWVHRAARGGDVLVPRGLASGFQAIDARDLAEFTLSASLSGLPGPFNATGPVPPITLLDVVRETARQAGVEADPVVVDDAFLAAQEPEVELPLWPGAEPSWAAWAQVDVGRALAAGLTFRPLAETVAATLADPPAPVSALGSGPALPSAEREAELIAAWRER